MRELQRTLELAVVLVHHASKKHRARPGQALRGSSDLHAFGDANAYLTRKDQHLVLTLEQRAARPPEPMVLELTSRPDGTATHLRVVGTPATRPIPKEPLTSRITGLLASSNEPLTRAAIRTQLRVNNNRLGDALQELEQAGRTRRTANGWQASNPPDKASPAQGSLEL